MVSFGIWKVGAFAPIHQNQRIMHVKCYVADNVTDKCGKYTMQG